LFPPLQPLAPSAIAAHKTPHAACRRPTVNPPLDNGTDATRWAARLATGKVDRHGPRPCAGAAWLWTADRRQRPASSRPLARSPRCQTAPWFRCPCPISLKAARPVEPSFQLHRSFTRVSQYLVACSERPATDAMNGPAATLCVPRPRTGNDRSSSRVVDFLLLV
jgi:hypothetical protein